MKKADLEVLGFMLAQADKRDREGKFLLADSVDRAAKDILVRAESARERMEDVYEPSTRKVLDWAQEDAQTRKVIDWAKQDAKQIPLPIEPIKKKDIQRERAKRLGTIQDAINAYNQILSAKGWDKGDYAKELVLSRSWAELDEQVQKFFGLRAGVDYTNWKQLIAKMRAKADQVPYYQVVTTTPKSTVRTTIHKENL